MYQSKAVAESHTPERFFSDYRLVIRLLFGYNQRNGFVQDTDFQREVAVKNTSVQVDFRILRTKHFDVLSTIGVNYLVVQDTSLYQHPQATEQLAKFGTVDDRNVTCP